jgi:hypothetical protein
LQKNALRLGPKRGIGPHRMGWENTFVVGTSKEGRPALLATEGIRTAVREYLDKEGYILLRPARIVGLTDQWSVHRALYKRKGERPRPSSQERLREGLERARDLVSLGLPTRRTREWFGSSSPWTPGDFATRHHRPRNLAESRRDRVEDTSRVSGGNRRALFSAATMHHPVSFGLATMLAMGLEDVQSQADFLSRVGLGLEEIAKARRVDAHGLPVRGRMKFGYEVEIHGTVDDSRRTTKQSMAHGKRMRNTVSTAVSYALVHAKTKTATRGVRVYFAYYD